MRLSESGADGLIPIRHLGTEYFNHVEARHALVGDRTGTTFRLGDAVRVRLVEAAPITGGLRFELADQPPVKPDRPARNTPRRKLPGPAVGGPKNRKPKHGGKKKRKT